MAETPTFDAAILEIVMRNVTEVQLTASGETTCPVCKEDFDSDNTDDLGRSPCYPHHVLHKSCLLTAIKTEEDRQGPGNNRPVDLTLRMYGKDPNCKRLIIEFFESGDAKTQAAKRVRNGTSPKLQLISMWLNDIDRNYTKDGVNGQLE